LPQHAQHGPYCVPSIWRAGRQIAILHEGDRPGDVRKITYGQMLSEVSRIANYFKSQGLVKGDTVAIYMPTIPEAVFTMLACARLGIVHR